VNFNSQNCTSNDPGHVASLALDVHNVEEAWLVTCGDPDIVVAVVDVFSSQLHEDLQGKIDTIFQIEAMDAEWLEFVMIPKSHYTMLDLVAAMEGL
jgi:hypothetical protein